MLCNIVTCQFICIFRNFKKGDAFVGYQDDTPAAVVFQVTHLLKNDDDNREMADEEACLLWRKKVIHIPIKSYLQVCM